MLLQVSYAIGVAEPVNIFVNTYGTSHVGLSDAEIADKVRSLVDLRPRAIEESLGLRAPIYKETASYGHMGRRPETVVKRFGSRYDNGRPIELSVKLFPLGREPIFADGFRKEFGL